MVTRSEETESRRKSPSLPDVPAPLARQLLGALQRESSVAFAYYDAEGRYALVSQGLAELNGLPAAEHLGRRPVEVMPADAAQAVEAVLARVLEDGQARREPRQRPGAGDWNDAVRFLDSFWSAVRDESGRIVGALAVAHDVTDRHRVADLLGSTQWRIGKLQSVARELAGALTISEVRAAVAKLGQVTGAAHVDLRLFDPAGRSPWPGGAYPAPPGAVPVPRRALRGSPEDRLAKRTENWPALLTAAIRYGQPCYLPDRESVRRQFPESADWRPFPESEQAWAVLPLITAAGPVGGVYLVYEDSRGFDQDDQAYLQALAGQCTMAVARARMHEREHRQVVALQDALLLKRLPEVAGMDSAFRYIPGSTDTEVGGDWYDLFRFGDGRIGMVVGDVIGKGVNAAAGMGRVRAALRALAFTDPSPRAVLAGLDRLFDATENHESLTTVAYAVLDPAGRRVLIGDAGHLPLLLLPAGGEPRYIEASDDAMPLGLSEPRLERELPMTPGDIVVGFSDGLVETRGTSLTDGLERLRLAAAEAARESLDILLDHLIDTMLRGREQDDDVTLLAVRIEP
ncbi:MAG TPA: SpoIIE family protein phosphatase [Actinocrinis sp.]|nr:SpoIIE family protein phosphatase [Actinocrinis sp.]